MDQEGWCKTHCIGALYFTPLCEDRGANFWQVESIDDVTRGQLKVIQEKRTHDTKIIADLKKRKLLNMQKVISFRISKGPKFALELVKEETDLTAEMLASGSWKTAAFKPYNFKALGADQHAGALHPLNKVRQEFRYVVLAVWILGVKSTDS